MDIAAKNRTDSESGIRRIKFISHPRGRWAFGPSRTLGQLALSCTPVMAIRGRQRQLTAKSTALGSGKVTLPLPGFAATWCARIIIALLASEIFRRYRATVSSGAVASPFRPLQCLKILVGLDSGPYYRVYTDAGV